MKKKPASDVGIDYPKAHPVTGEMAKDGYHWIRHALTGEWMQEADWTPWCCSAASEGYFAK